ncbi:ATP-dependent zinc protease [Candidatus Kuenenbacteria bacterium]|nr:ATP-dependent zinc protease [Candidatus Kuenenbacteria bacterium]
MLSWLKKSNQVLGMNARNLKFIRPGATKNKIALVDDKLRTKKLLEKHELPVPRIITVIRNRKEFYRFDWTSLPKSFVLKPNRGLGGEGIVVTFGRKKNGKWVLPLNKEASVQDIMLRVSNILDGDYSKTNVPDAAFFEERLKIHPTFKLYSYKGIPDVRVIVYNKVPVMAMLRLPTKNSKGKANLHQGGVCVGIDIATGITTNAIQFDRLIENLPDLKLPLRGIKIPMWDDILELSIKAAIACGLNYTGVDIAIDREKGPVILELNAHPGLSIQIANEAPLKDRLLRVRGLKIQTVKRGIKMAKELFGGEIETEVEGITGKKILGIVNKIKIKDKKNNWHEIEAKMDTGAGITSIDEEFAKKIGFSDAISYYLGFGIKRLLTKEEVEELSKKQVWKELEKHKDIVAVAKIYSSHGISYRMEVPLKLQLGGVEISSNATVIIRENMKYPVIIGRRDLKKFLIDPTK